MSKPAARKYRDVDDSSPAVKPKKKRAPKLDPYKPVVDSWLLQDRRRRAKQRHTAKRIYDRPVAECGFDGGYTTVQQYVRARKSELKRAKNEFLHLGWAPAEAQADFGVCDFRVLGIVREGLKAIFEFCGGVPLRLVFDNATGVGRRVGEAMSIADAFGRFAAHYGFASTFCNPYSGNEKGAAENAVGAVRRNSTEPTATRPPGRATRSPSSPSFAASRVPGATARCAPRCRRSSCRQSTRWADPTGRRRSRHCGA